MHIRLARYIDADDIIKFINDNWKENHILARDRKLFLYEFRNGDALNFAIAKNNGHIIGVFGFLKYSNDIEPDMGAAKAGIEKGDVILSLDKLKIAKFSDLSGYLSTKRPGDIVLVCLIRNAIKLNIKVKL